MAQEVLRPRSASFVVRGFRHSPDEVAGLIGVPSTSSGVIGTPAAPGKTLLKRSYVLFCVDLPPETPLFQMVPQILDHLGGTAHLVNVLSQVKPELVEVDLALPVKDSPEQEGGFISSDGIAALHLLGATISFSFLRRAAEA